MTDKYNIETLLTETMKQVEKPDSKTKHTRLKWMIICAVLMVIVGCCLIIAGMIIPPLGEIHPSVLTAVGEFLTFSGSLFGLNTNYRIKTERMDMDMGMKHEEE